jgi:peroxiredoxin
MLTEFRSQLGAYPTFQSLEREIKTRAAQRDQVKPGTQAFDFILPDSSGTDHRLSAHKKTVVLLDFWASWCGPCIVQFPALKALHTAYSNRGLTIIGISIDDDRRRWVQALRKQNPPGLQLLATQNQAIKDNYAVFGIPHLCLIDEHGNVITNDLEGAALQQKIAQLLGDKP